jgi:hypothetical protein
MAMFGLPGPLVLTLWPLGVELLVAPLIDRPGLPVFAVLGAAQAVAAWHLYRRVLRIEGRWLYDREDRILDAVARQSE